MRQGRKQSRMATEANCSLHLLDVVREGGAAPPNIDVMCVKGEGVPRIEEKPRRPLALMMSNTLAKSLATMMGTPCTAVPPPHTHTHLQFRRRRSVRSGSTIVGRLSRAGSPRIEEM